MHCQLRKLAWLLFALPAFGQSTTVSGTVADLAGQTWINGSYSISFVPPPGKTPPYMWNGSVFNPQIYSGSLDNTGSFTISLPSNTAISPSGSQWKFTITPLASAPAHVVNILISGATQNVSTNLSATNPAITFFPTPMFFGYADSEVLPSPGIGQAYFNTTSLIPKYWNGSIWTNYGGGGTGDSITSPNSTLNVGGTSTATTLDINLSKSNTWLATTTFPALVDTSALSILTRANCPLYSGSACNQTSMGETGWNAASPQNLVAHYHNYASWGSAMNSTGYEGDVSDGDLWHTYWGAGNHATLSIQDNQQGGGDHQTLNIYSAFNTGATSPGNQGGELLSAQGGEGSYPRLTLATAGTPNSFGQVSVTFSAFSCPNAIPYQNCWPSQVSRIADITQTAVTGQFTGPETTFSPVNWLKQIPTTGSLPEATAWGSCTSCNLTQTTSGDLPVSQIFTLTAGSGTFTTGLACFVGGTPGTFEQAKITAVSGSAGSQTITVPLGYQAGGIFVIQGSDPHICGLLSMDGDLAQGSQHTPGYIAVGSTDGTNEIVGVEAYGSTAASGIPSPIPSGQEPEIAVANAAFATSTAYTQGQYFSDGTTNCTYTDNGVSYADPCTWEVGTAGTSGGSAPSWTGTVGSTITSGGMIATNMGPVTSFHIFAAARVLTNTMNTTTGTNGSQTFSYASSLLEPNAMSLNTGDKMVDPNWDNMATSAINTYMQCLSPGQCTPELFTASGAGFSSGYPVVGVQNWNPDSMYLTNVQSTASPNANLPTGLGTPNAFYIGSNRSRGLFSNLFEVNSAPSNAIFDVQNNFPGSTGFYFLLNHGGSSGSTGGISLYEDLTNNRMSVLNGNFYSQGIIQGQSGVTTSQSYINPTWLFAGHPNEDALFFYGLNTGGTPSFLTALSLQNTGQYGDGDGSLCIRDTTTYDTGGVYGCNRGLWAGYINTPTLTVSGLTSGYYPLAGTGGQFGNGHLDDGVTTASTITAHEPIAIAGSTHGLSMPAGTSFAGAAATVVYTVDSTNGYGELNENNTGNSRICTAGNGVCSGSGSGTVTDGSGTTTANQVAVSTTTAHQLQYVTSLMGLTAIGNSGAYTQSGASTNTFTGAVDLSANLVLSSAAGISQTGTGTNSLLGTAMAGMTVTPLGTATSGTNYNSNTGVYQGSFWNGSATTDYWQWQNVIGTGSSPTSTLTLTHSGSGGTATVSVPNISIPGATSGSYVKADGTGYGTPSGGSSPYVSLLAGGASASGCTISGYHCTVGTATGTISFSSIPSSSTNMVLSCTLVSAGIADIYLAINGDTNTADYATVGLNSNKSSSSINYNYFSGDPYLWAGNIGASGSASPVEAEFMGYSITGLLDKAALFSSGPFGWRQAGYPDATWGNGHWFNTAAITQLTLTLQSGLNFGAGSTCTLDGID